MRRTRVFPLACIALLLCGCVAIIPQEPRSPSAPTSTGVPTRQPTLVPTIRPDHNMILIFEDNFSGPALNTEVWHTSYRWGRTNNNEAQYYSPNAFTFVDGCLRITAAENATEGKSYTSGVIASFDRFTFTYGYVEMRARLPAGQGLWPAFWMHLNNDDQTGEIDVFELLGHQPTVLYMTLHWPDPAGRNQDESFTYDGPDFSRDFHVFAVDWQPAQVVWYVDGAERVRVNHDVPAEPMYLIANLAVGGTWPGFPDATTRFPAFYEIDYIRVSQRP